LAGVVAVVGAVILARAIGFIVGDLVGVRDRRRRRVGRAAFDAAADHGDKRQDEDSVAHGCSPLAVDPTGGRRRPGAGERLVGDQRVVEGVDAFVDVAEVGHRDLAAGQERAFDVLDELVAARGGEVEVLRERAVAGGHDRLLVATGAAAAFAVGEDDVDGAAAVAGEAQRDSAGPTVCAEDNGHLVVEIEIAGGEAVTPRRRRRRRRRDRTLRGRVGRADVFEARAGRVALPALVALAGVVAVVGAVILAGAIGFLGGELVGVGQRRRRGIRRAALDAAADHGDKR